MYLGGETRVTKNDPANDNKINTSCPSAEELRKAGPFNSLMSVDP